jgi:hypothetical protein
MDQGNCKKEVLDTIQEALEHIKGVQTDLASLNYDSMTILNEVFFESDIEISEHGFIALQHQDILTQQLNATCELIEMIDKHIQNSSPDDLAKNIASSLEVAKAKKEAFSGNAFGIVHQDYTELLA